MWNKTLVPHSKVWEPKKLEAKVIVLDRSDLHKKVWFNKNSLTSNHLCEWAHSKH